MSIGDGIFGATLIIALVGLYLFGDIDNETLGIIAILAFGVFIMLAGD